MSANYSLEQMIDFEKYPINRRGSDAYNKLLKTVKATIQEKGSVSLNNFLNSKGTNLLQQTVIDKTPEANRTRRFNNVYDIKEVSLKIYQKIIHLIPY